jgi:hypothetical protein
MKKLIALALITLCIMPYQIGDMNRDGKITTTDLVRLRLSIGLYDKMADLNFDGIVDENDLRIMRYKLANE